MVEAARGRRKPLHHSHDLGVAQAIKVGFWPILSKKSEYRLGPIFSAPWARFSEQTRGTSSSASDSTERVLNRSAAVVSVTFICGSAMDLADKAPCGLCMLIIVALEININPDYLCRTG